MSVPAATTSKAIPSASNSIIDAIDRGDFQPLIDGFNRLYENHALDKINVKKLNEDVWLGLNKIGDLLKAEFASHCKTVSKDKKTSVEGMATSPLVQIARANPLIAVLALGTFKNDYYHRDLSKIAAHNRRIKRNKATEPSSIIKYIFDGCYLNEFPNKIFLVFIPN